MSDGTNITGKNPPVHYMSPFAAKNAAAATQVSGSADAAVRQTSPIPPEFSSGAHLGEIASPFANRAYAGLSATKSGASKFDQLIAEMDAQMNPVAITPDAGNQESRVADNRPYDIFDVLDIINPLQHIPVVSNIYRAVTGDEIRQEIRVAGNLVIGALAGPVALVAGVGDSVVDVATGKPLGDHVLAAVAPDLEQNIREDYSVAHYLHNPFAGDDSSKNPGPDLVEEAKTASVASRSSAWQRPDFASANAANSAPGLIVAQPLEQLAGANTVPATSTSAKTPLAKTPLAKTALAKTALAEAAPVKITPVKITPAAPYTVSAQTAEASDMARSITQNPNAVMQISPAAAAQLSRLADATQNPDSSTDPVALFNGDAGQQIRAATAKNRQLGLALDSSATINQQISDAQQQQVSFEVGNRVAALYRQNEQVTSPSRQLLNSALPPIPDTQTPQISPAIVPTALNTEQHEQWFGDTPAQRDLAAPPEEAASASGVPVTPALNRRPGRALKPNELGQHYHGADASVNLSIAQAMQRALDKYRHLNR